MAASNAPKRTLRDIWPHLVVSACALLLPPLGMAAGVVYLGSPHPHEIAASSPAEHAAVAVAAEPTKAPDPGPAVASPCCDRVANAVPSPAEQRPAPEPQVAAAPAPHPPPRRRRASRMPGPRTRPARTRPAARMWLPPRTQPPRMQRRLQPRRRSPRSARHPSAPRGPKPQRRPRLRTPGGSRGQCAAIRPEVAARVARRSRQAGARPLDHRHLPAPDPYALTPARRHQPGQ